MSYQQDDIKRLLINHNRRLQGLKEKKALYGLETPVAILTEIQDIEIEIQELQAELVKIGQFKEIEHLPIASDNAQINMERQIVDLEEEPSPKKLRVWQYRPLAIHYLNVHRLFAIFAEKFSSNNFPVKLEKVNSIRELAYDEYHALMNFTNQMLKRWNPKVLNPNNSENLSIERLGCVFEFSFAEFRTKNIRYWDGKTSKPKMYGDIDKDPHLYCYEGKLKIYLPLNYSWITTDTAFHNFRPRNGTIRGFSGLTILKNIDDGIAVFSPLFIGTHNFMAEFGDLDDTIRSFDMLPSWW